MGGEDVGTYAIQQNTLALSSNYTLTYVGANLTINRRPTTISYTGATTAYSGQCTVKVSATLLDGLNSTGISGATVTITIGTQSTTLTTNGSGVASGTMTLTQSPGTVNATASYAGSAIHLSSTNSLANPPGFVISTNPYVGAVPNQPIYTGSLFFWTTGPSSSTSTLTLSATIKDTDTVCIGDIRKAKVTFAARNIGGSYAPLSNAQNLPVGLVNPSDTTVGTATAISQYNIGSSDVGTIEVAVIVTGNYYFNQTASDTYVTVVKPGVANSMAGGGALNNAALPASSGYLAGAPGAANYATFSTNVKYNKSGTNPQGKVNVLVKSYNKPDGTADTSIHTYSITSNSIAEMTLPKPGQMSFGSKANIVDITNPSSSVGLDSGATLQITLTDGSPDKVGIVLQRRSGGVWFSSAWDGQKTVEKPLAGGNVVIQ